MRIIFMCVGIAEVHEEPVTQELGNVSVKTLDDFSTSRLIDTYHVSVHFWVELRCQLRRFHQITEHHGQLPSFRVGRRRCSWERCDLRGGLFLGSRLWCWLNRGRGCGRGFCSVPSPHEHSAIFIRGELLRLNNLRLECFEILVV
jgi:hypothetical protein